MPSMPAVHKKLRTLETVHCTGGSVFLRVSVALAGGGTVRSDVPKSPLASHVICLQFYFFTQRGLFLNNSYVNSHTSIIT